MDPPPDPPLTAAAHPLKAIEDPMLVSNTANTAHDIVPAMRGLLSNVGRTELD